jgi:hypothetical protein
MDPQNLNLPRQTGSTLSLTNLIRTFGIEPERTCTMHNAGNDAFMALTALQLLLEPKTKVTELRPPSASLGVGRGTGTGTGTGMVRRPMSMVGSSRNINLAASPTKARFSIANMPGTPSMSRHSLSANDPIANEWGARQSGYAAATVAAGRSLAPGGQRRRGKHAGQLHSQPQQGKDVQSAMEQLQL